MCELDGCKRLREVLPGLCACCTRCHAHGEMQAAQVQGERFTLCCALVSAVINRHGGSFDVDWTDDLKRSGAFPMTLVTERERAAG